MASLSLLVLSLLACDSTQLNELEEEHEALRVEVDDLAQNVASLRNDMVELGLLTQEQSLKRVPIDAQPVPTNTDMLQIGHQTPENPLADRVEVTAERVGTPPKLPKLEEAQRAGDPCGWRFQVRSLQPLSDFPLNRDGFGKVSPVLLFENGEALEPHALPGAYEGACAGAFRHAGYVFLFSPRGERDAPAQNTYAVALDERFPIPRGDDARPTYWVYPGTTATFRTNVPWDAAWGKPMLSVGGRALEARDRTASVSSTGLEREIDGTGDFEVSGELSRDGEPLTIEISSPEGGPYVLIDVLTVGNDDHALVVTSPIRGRD